MAQGRSEKERENGKKYVPCHAMCHTRDHGNENGNENRIESGMSGRGRVDSRGYM